MVAIKQMTRVGATALALLVANATALGTSAYLCVLLIRIHSVNMNHRWLSHV
jgi:hypothetical protein